MTAHAKKEGNGRFPVWGLQTFHPPPALPGAAGSAPLRLGFALCLMAGLTQRLHVACIVQATFGQGLDVIALGGQRDPSVAFAFNTQWGFLEQLSAHGLQLATRDTLGSGHWLGPGFLWMLDTAVAAITHQHPATRLTAGFGSGLGHG